MTNALEPTSTTATLRLGGGSARCGVSVHLHVHESQLQKRSRAAYDKDDQLRERARRQEDDIQSMRDRCSADRCSYILLVLSHVASSLTSCILTTGMLSLSQMTYSKPAERPDRVELDVLCPGWMSDSSWALPTGRWRPRAPSRGPAVHATAARPPQLYAQRQQSHSTITASLQPSPYCPIDDEMGVLHPLRRHALLTPSVSGRWSGSRPDSSSFGEEDA